MGIFKKVWNKRDHTPVQWSNGLVFKALDSQSRVLGFKITGWLQGQLSLSSFRGRSIEHQELLETEW